MPGFVRKHEAVWDELVLQEHPLLTSLRRAGAWNMEQAVPRYHVCFTVTAAALAGSTYQTSDGASKRRQK